MWWIMVLGRLAVAQTPIEIEALAVLGPPPASPHRLPTADGPPVELLAELSTQLDCGVLRTDSNLKEVGRNAAQALQRLEGQILADAERVVAASPYLILCKFVPEICEVTRELKAQVKATIDDQVSVCRLIDSEIGRLGGEGEQRRRMAQHTALQQCLAQSGGDGTAYRRCLQATANPKALDIATGLERPTWSSASQQVLSSALQATKHPLAERAEVYALVRGLGGELRQQPDHTLIPEAHPAWGTAEFLEGLQALAVDAACVHRKALVEGKAATPAPFAWQYAQSHVAAALRNRLLPADRERLDQLSPTTQQVLCHGLGRTVARAAARSLGAELLPLLRHAKLNPALQDAAKARLELVSGTIEQAIETLEADPQIVDYATWSAELLGPAVARQLRKNAAKFRVLGLGTVRLVAPPTCRTGRDCEGR